MRELAPSDLPQPAPAPVAGPPGEYAPIPALTSIRAFAAMAIVLLHLGLATGVHVVPASWVLTQGLSVFFVLSGFILAYRYPSLPSGRNTARYLIARVARIWPLHLFTLFVVALLQPIPFQYSAGAVGFLLNAFLLHAWVPIYKYYASFNSPSFSLSIELFLYACFPLLIRGKRWAVKLGVPLLLAAGMIFLADRVLPSGSRVDAAGLAYNHPLSRLWEFAVGIAAAAVWRRVRARKMPSRSVVTALELIVVAAVVANVAMATRLISAVDAGLGLGARLWIANAGLTALPIAALLVLLALQRGLVGRVLSWPPLVLFGDISYSTYLLHGILLLLVVYRWDVFRRLSDAQLAATFCAMVLVASYLSWALIEVPARALLLRLSDKLLNRPGVARQGQWRIRATWKGLATCAVVVIGITALLYSARSRSAFVDLQPVTGRAIGVVERIDGSPPRNGVATVRDGDSISVSGWAVDSAFRSSVRGMLLTIDDGRQSWLRGGLQREDVVSRTRDGRYRFSGFEGTVETGELGPGTYTLELRAVLYRPEGYVRLAPLRLRVR